MAKLTVNDLDLQGKRVFTRVDYNVPMAPMMRVNFLHQLQQSKGIAQWRQVGRRKMGWTAAQAGARANRR